MAEKTITQLTAIDSLATGDEFAVYDASATSTKKATAAQVKSIATDVDINGLSSATPVSGDSVVIYDLSATANRKATLGDILALGSSAMDIVGLTGAQPSIIDDVIPFYDASDTGNRKATMSSLRLIMTAVDINGLSSATPATNDSIVIYDLSATANRKATISDILALGGGGSGKLALTLTPYAAVLPSSNFPQLNHSNNRPVLGFDASTNESCTWTFYATAGLSGALTAKVYWIAASATSGDVIWTVEVEAITPGDSTDLDATTSFASANSGTTTVPGTAGYLAVTSITLTNDDSIAANDYVRVRLTRNASSGSDTASGDANVLFLAIQES